MSQIRAAAATFIVGATALVAAGRALDRGADPFQVESRRGPGSMLGAIAIGSSVHSGLGALMMWHKPSASGVLLGLAGAGLIGGSVLAASPPHFDPWFA